MGFVLSAVFAAIMYFDFHGREGREQSLYLVLSALAIILSFIAGTLAARDHVGATLSGMISIFMR